MTLDDRAWNSCGYCEKKRSVEEEEKQIQALIADIDKRQNSAKFSTTAASKLAEIVPNRCIDSATRARIFMQEYQKRKLTTPAQESTETIKIGDQMCSPTQLFERCKLLKDEKDRAFSEKMNNKKGCSRRLLKQTEQLHWPKKRPECSKRNWILHLPFSINGVMYTISRVNVGETIRLNQM